MILRTEESRRIPYRLLSFVQNGADFNCTSFVDNKSRSF
jgi:hypothetical protein